MTSYSYEAVDPSGSKKQGTMEVATQDEALRRIKEMGLFPTRVFEQRPNWRPVNGPRGQKRGGLKNLSITLPFFSGRVKPALLAAFTRQLATLVDAGMPLLRGLRLLREQETNHTFKAILQDIEVFIENGGSLSDALSAYPRVFDRLYINMVKAGELGGALEISLDRLAGFIEKAQRIKGKVKTAMFYPSAVMIVAIGILALMMAFVIPKFQSVFEGLLPGQAMPWFTMFVFQVSNVLKHNLLAAVFVLAAGIIGFVLALRTDRGCRIFDRFKLRAPVLGRVFRKAAISRFTRTLGTLLNSGVPVLQSLNIVKETVGNVIVGSAVIRVHDSVKEGETMTAPLRASQVFPPVIVGMIDIGEQTGALPDMLMKIADNCDEEVDNAVTAMTSLLEPLLIVFLAVVVGSLVIAMFLPLLALVGGGMGPAGAEGDN